MDSKTLELMLISAKDLKNVGNFSKMDVYVLVTISRDPNRTKLLRSPVHKGGGINPEWNYPMKFNISESAAQMTHSVLEFILRCERRLSGDDDIGKVEVPIKQLLDIVGNNNCIADVKFPVWTNSGKKQGELNFSFLFCDATSSEKIPDNAHCPSNSPKKNPSPTSMPQGHSPPLVYPYPQNGHPPVNYLNQPTHPPMPGYPMCTCTHGLKHQNNSQSGKMNPPANNMMANWGRKLIPALFTFGGPLFGAPAVDPSIFSSGLAIDPSMFASGPTIDPSFFTNGIDSAGAAFPFDPSAYGFSSDVSSFTEGMMM